MSKSVKKKQISIIIPVFNEEKLIKKQIINLIKSIKNINDFEIILIENGSKDKTYLVATKLAKEHPELKVLRQEAACYGMALKRGISEAKYNNIAQFDIDLIDIKFFKSAVSRINNFDIIIGSKLHPLSTDVRGWYRILATKLLNIFIRQVFSYNGTDTHGIKFYKKNKVEKLLNKIKTKHHLFETELILRAVHGGYKILELPITVREIRPTRFATVVRLFNALQELILLFALRKELKNG